NQNCMPRGRPLLSEDVERLVGGSRGWRRKPRPVVAAPLFPWTLARDAGALGAAGDASRSQYLRAQAVRPKSHRPGGTASRARKTSGTPISFSRATRCRANQSGVKVVIRASIIAMLVVLGRSSSARATVASDLCPGAQDPCVVNTAVTVDPGSVI